MKILVYGAGVIGCELAHELAQAGKHVTILARGEWKNSLEQNGLVIRHWAQMRTTTDNVQVIDKLRANMVFDLIFVVMQYVQLTTALPILAANRSRYIVLVGNNADAETALRMLTDGHPNKEVAFGFQGTAGRRETKRVVSIHLGVGMTVGPFHGHLSTEFQHRIEKAFYGEKYRLTWENNMDAWLKCHLVLILPVAYVCYAVDCDLTKATKSQRETILDAALEGCAMLRQMGIDIRAEDSEDYFKPGAKRRKMEILLLFMAKTPIGRLAASDHCRNAVDEMLALDAVFERYRECMCMPMPAWEQLRSLKKPDIISAYSRKKEDAYVS